MQKLSLMDIDVAAKRVLLRVDFNVPLTEDGLVSDDTRIVAALPTLKYLVEHQAKVVLVSHLGRPGGEVVAQLSLKPVAARLSEIIGQPVAFANDCIGPEAANAVKALGDGEILLLENLRFHVGEEANDATFAKQLAESADVYVNDAFGTAHRAHASTEAITRYVQPAVCGLLMERELKFLGEALTNPERPFVAVLGGAKVSDKIDVVQNLLGKVDSLLIGGGMANTFLVAQGKQLGRSLVEAERVAFARELLEQAAKLDVQIHLPVDAIIATGIDAAQGQVVAIDEVPAEAMVLDIGPNTSKQFAAALANAKLIVWNGPMGVFERPNFAAGTYNLAQAVAETSATTIIGGGDSAAAIAEAGLADRITHISTGGGASLQFLGGKELPGVKALTERRQ